MFEFNKHELLKQFQLNLPARYHQGSLQRVSHLSNDKLREAAVFIGFVERKEGMKVILTQRAKHLKHHPGQVSFPGGKREQSDRSLFETALRETQEEIGIPDHQIEVFGNMPELVTISQFKVTPYLGFVDSSYQAKIDKNEVDSVFELPLEIMLDRDQLHSAEFNIKQRAHRVFGLPYEGYFIWGMTAQIIQAIQQQVTLPFQLR